MPGLTPINLTASTSITPSMADTVITINTAAGSTHTLPAALGTGYNYKFFIGTTVSSGSVIIKVANSVDIMSGVALVCQDAGSTLNGWETAAADDTISMNGTTTGGVKGDYVMLTDAISGVWSVNMWGSATGIELTPFASTV